MKPYKGREPYIFLSYARKDWERVKPYVEAMSGEGYRVWWDEGISAGAHWTETLVEKIENCALFCPMFSEAFKASRFCFEETDYAYRKDKAIVPLYLERTGNLRPLFRLLEARQNLRLYDFSPAQFAERLGQEQAFTPCKPPEWNRVGQIQWRLDANGLLTIAANEALPDWFGASGSIPSYQYDPIHKGSTAPWMPYREKIYSVKIGDNIDVIGENAFLSCKNLTKAVIGERVTTIGDFAFRGCHRLTNVRIPNSVTEIRRWAFFACKNLKSIRISDNVTAIGDFAFSGCKNLTVVRILDSVTEIGNFAFSECENLTSVEISSRAHIGEYAFPNHTRVTRRDAPS